jgi:secreted trypsin-like serine protease
MIETFGGGRIRTAGFDDCAAIGRLDAAGWYASGVLVHPRLVLTTAHSGPPGHSPIPRAVILGAGDLSDSSSAEIIEAEFVAHEDYLGKGACDLAAMLLARESAIPPVALASSNEIAGAGQVILAGFGSDQEARLALTIRRAVSVPLRFYSALPTPIVPQEFASVRFNPQMEFIAGSPDCGPNFGDSGGPAYISVNGERKLAGIISRPAARQRPFCKGLTIFTRVDAFAPWIRALIAKLRSTAPKADASTPADLETQIPEYAPKDA